LSPRFRLAFVSGLFAIAAASTASAQVRAVPYVDLGRYAGLWHEIARFPNSFQRDCGATTAEYQKRSDGKISVKNTCRLRSPGVIDRLGNPSGVNVAEGVAEIADKTSNAKLKVTFLPTFLRWLTALGIANADYWVIDLGARYEYAVVSEPTRNYLWVLSRTPTMSRAVYDAIRGRARAQGLDTSRLQITVPGTVR